MTTHPDAIGYLDDLAGEVSKPWFTMICDLAVAERQTALTPVNLETLCAVFAGAPPPARDRQTSDTPACGPVASSIDFLEKLLRFSNFKRLSDTLTLNFTTPITILFGANGSGKSSICTALKLLADPIASAQPLEDIRGSSTTAPSFGFKFRSEQTEGTWTEQSALRMPASPIRYFDGEIAGQNVSSPIDPGRVVSLAPFKLHIFERVNQFLTQFRQSLQQLQETEETKLSQGIGAIRTEFQKYGSCPLSGDDLQILNALGTEIESGQSLADLATLPQKRELVAAMERASSGEGLELLKAERQDLQRLSESLSTLLDIASRLWALGAARKIQELRQRRDSQRDLAGVLVQAGTLDELLALLQAAAAVSPHGLSQDTSCPLCRQALGATEIDLFARYDALLTGELAQDVGVLQADVNTASELAREAVGVDPAVWAGLTTLPPDLVDEATTLAGAVLASCRTDAAPSAEAIAACSGLRLLGDSLASRLKDKTEAITLAQSDTEGLQTRLASLRAELLVLEYQKTVSDSADRLKLVCETAKAVDFWRSELPSFTALLTKVTNAAKAAHEELVISDFETRLNAEYRALSERSLDSYGIRFARVGRGATVSVLSQVGGYEIVGVLSEGEQRLHALALFFAELETCSPSVVVFDDPVSSFDYNYIATYCVRLRDFAHGHPESQLIVLTHNWECFVCLQTTFNRAGLDSRISVQILEDCAVAAAYTEKCGELKASIEETLQIVGSLSREQKERVAGQMRRLVEAVVNTHVFNNQRHQYKQKNLQVAAFQSFTRLVPLLPQEASELTDLYSALSVTEHDDPRNAYVATDKAVFQSRYDRIVAVEAALVARKQP